MIFTSVNVQLVKDLTPFGLRRLSATIFSPKTFNYGVKCEKSRGIPPPTEYVLFLQLKTHEKYFFYYETRVCVYT